MIAGIYKTVTDGKVFRILHILFGNENFVGLPTPLEFESKAAAETYIHKYLSLAKWEDA